MKRFFTKTSIWSVVCAALLWSSYSQAAVVKVRGERAGHWDASFMLNYVEGETVTDGFAESKVDNNMGWGLGFHYNFNAHWNLGFDMAFNNPDYTAKVIDPQDQSIDFVDHSANRFDGQINGQYNILSGSFTPYIQAGLGWTYIDSNIVKSLSYYCSGYYYPYCRTYANTYDDTAFSYNLGVGLRWDVSDAIFLKLAYIQQWVDSSGSPSPQTGRAEIGFMF
jgi:opacity protein-like surface antigen